MRLFVSYARTDNPPQRLVEIESELRTLGGSVYIDDIHHPPDGDRRDAVLAALGQADIFVVIKTPSYLRTEWTRLEFDKAMNAGLPLAVLEVGAELRPGAYEALLGEPRRALTP